MHSEAHTGGRQIARLPVEQHASPQHHDAIEILGHRAELVRHEQHGGAVLTQQVHERVSEKLLRLRVHAGDRLVEDEELGLGGQRLGDQDALLLSTRELDDALFAQPFQRHRLERVTDRVPINRSRPAPPPLLGEAAGGDDLLDRRRKVGCQARTLRHVPQAPAVGETPGRGAEQLHPARLRRQETQDDAQQRRFAGPVRADEGRELTGSDLEGDVVEDAMGAEGERDALDGQEGIGDGSLHMRSIPILGSATLLGVEPAGASRSKVSVAASFYPVAFAAEKVGGTRVDVTNLTPIGAEPHDLELNSEQLDRLLEAKVAFVLGNGFQPAVEKAADRRDGSTVDLLPKLVDARGTKVAKEGKTGGLDPHVWLDPILMSQLVAEVERGLAAADPKGAATYEKNALALQDQLGALDTRYRDRLTGCSRDLLVTSHEAFGYLANRYRLRQEGVAGLSPDAEPDPARLGDLAQLSLDQGVTTVFTEETVSPRIAQTLARDAGGLRTEVLSPLESLTKRERDDKADYFTLMDANLGKIATALGCP